MRFLRVLPFVYALGLVQSWGELGHRTVAYLAEKYLTTEAVEFVNTLLANDRGYDISDGALWADVIKRREGYKHTAEWHYIDAKDDPPRTCNVNYKRDCHAGPGCIVSAITNFTARLDNTDLDPIQHKEALMFLLHFLADIHQPLHTELLSRGGNDIHVCFDGHCSRAENLHSVWDTHIPHKMRGLPSKEGDDEIVKPAAKAWAEALFAENEARGRKAVGECRDIRTAEKCALAWAGEANRWICERVLKRGVEWVEGHDLGGVYFEEAAPVVNELMANAGLRLGAWLNGLAAAQETGFAAQNGERLDL